MLHPSGHGRKLGGVGKAGSAGFWSATEVDVEQGD
jgi:hypothetical protein